MRVEYVARGPLRLAARSLTLRQGDVLDLPSNIVNRYADRFKILVGDPIPVELADPPDVSELHVGGGWYDLGDGVKVRRAEAEARLADGS